ncbi:polymorphic toxin type 15 domain-containing protein [Serratia ficaria]|uniref:polymorphic toxin type 15 domain-containing protein n=1 Tax=Serratia ficaria TaxID=61651 RepID=UPI0011AB4690|nr:polymorphic toxin type 15 domain-containing protein [Serratia ficaria]
MQVAGVNGRGRGQAQWRAIRCVTPGSTRTTKAACTKLNADHPVDLIVGGSPTQRLQMLNESINKSVGSSLKMRVENQASNRETELVK